MTAKVRIMTLSVVFLFIAVAESYSCDFSNERDLIDNRSLIYKQAKRDTKIFYHDTTITDMGQPFPSNNAVLNRIEVYVCYIDINNKGIICYMGSDYNGEFHLYTAWYNYDMCSLNNPRYMRDNFIDKETKIRNENGNKRIVGIARTRWHPIPLD